MTTVGEQRARYAALIERGPSRFTGHGEPYRAWAARAEAWAARTSAEDALAGIATQSLALPLVNGTRLGDPLALITGDNWTQWLEPLRKLQQAENSARIRAGLPEIEHSTTDGIQAALDNVTRYRTHEAMAACIRASARRYAMRQSVSAS